MGGAGCSGASVCSGPVSASDQLRGLGFLCPRLKLGRPAGGPFALLRSAAPIPRPAAQWLPRPDSVSPLISCPPPARGDVGDRRREWQPAGRGVTGRGAERQRCGKAEAEGPTSRSRCSRHLPSAVCGGGTRGPGGPALPRPPCLGLRGEVSPITGRCQAHPRPTERPRRHQPGSE